MNNLLRLIARRLVALPIMVVGVSFLVFFIMSLSPIDPAYSALGETATPEALEAYRVERGLNEPFFTRYGMYLWNMLHGDLGLYATGKDYHVSDLVAQALPVTLQLTFLGLFFAVVIAFPLGVIAALYRDLGDLHWYPLLLAGSAAGLGFRRWFHPGFRSYSCIRRRSLRLVPSITSSRHRIGCSCDRPNDPRRAYLDG